MRAVTYLQMDYKLLPGISLFNHLINIYQAYIAVGHCIRYSSEQNKFPVLTGSLCFRGGEK